ncbi:MAG: transcriptional repressor [Candidatus Kerfeldbacteria bacterium]|nr:transcriptional repressor [Candidatus Kerfeldbacteria bacterium]
MALHSHQQQIVELLQRRGERLTKPRLAVLTVLCQQRKPVSVKDLEQYLPHINIVTLYRIVEHFISLGVVTGFNHTSNERVFEVSDPFHPHHHHTICRVCGTMRDVACKLSIPKLLNFTPESHSVVIYGRCKTCHVSS